MRILPKAILGELVQYLDIRTDVFMPGLETQWRKASQIEIKTTIVRTHKVPRDNIGIRTETYVNGTLHSMDDLPAVADAGNRQWYRCGQLHRDGDQPAKMIIGSGKVLVQEWYQYGKLHHNGDQPAVINENGFKKWYKHGKLHRDGDQPAIERLNGSKDWYQDGKCHRDGDQPASISANGRKEWWQHGQCHRGDDKPAIVDRQGTEWWFHDKRHRDHDRPAVVNFKGTEEWWQHGVRHRENDKPAFENHDDGRKEWWRGGRFSRDHDRPIIETIQGDKIWGVSDPFHRILHHRVQLSSGQVWDQNSSRLTFIDWVDTLPSREQAAVFFRGLNI